MKIDTTTVEKVDLKVGDLVVRSYVSVSVVYLVLSDETMKLSSGFEANPNTGCKTFELQSQTLVKIFFLFKDDHVCRPERVK